MTRMADPISTADRIIDQHGVKKEALVQILLDVQKELRWLPRDVLKRVADRLEVTLNQIYHVATFYKHFSLVPQGRHQMSVCLGTACHVRGARKLLDRVSSVVKVSAGETSKDEKFSLHTVNCVGCCALGPVMTVDGEYLSNPTTEELERVVERCE
jgi:NADH-quinone oxidoreductase subunit E